jgi:hypothetical protein
MNSNNKLTLLIGLIIIIGSLVAYYYEDYKSSSLIQVKCTLIKYDCIGRGAHTTFNYNNQIKTIGGIPRKLCDNNIPPNTVIVLYHSPIDDTFYFEDNTFANRYLLFGIFGILICTIPYFTGKINKLLYNKL